MNCKHDKIPDNAILQPITFATKSLSSVEWCYSNMGCEALGILHGLEKFYHYSFVRDIFVITDQKIFVTILSKYMVMLSQWSQCILLQIHQYRVYIIYNIRHNHKESKDQEIKEIRVNVNAITISVNIPVCTSIHVTQTAIHEHVHIQELKTYITKGWPHKKEEVTQGIRQYWPMRKELAMIDGIVMRDKRIIIPFNYRSRYCNSCIATTWEWKR